MPVCQRMPSYALVMFTTAAFGTAAANMFVTVIRYALSYPPHDCPVIPMRFGSMKPFAMSDCTPGMMHFAALGPGAPIV